MAIIMKKILIVEDDTHINSLLHTLLTAHGYQVIQAYSGTEGLMCLGAQEFDLILLDLMLPGVTGDAILATIREKSQTPVIILTAIANKEKTVTLLKLGANDYVVKPFNNDELLARMDIWLRQKNNESSAQLTFKDVILDVEKIKAYVADSEIQLSKREFGILECMMRNPKKVFTKNNLYETVWQEHFIGDDNTINVHISNLRNKLAKINPNIDYIKTVWGIGFKMND